jgi:hypothetical protein
MEVRLLSWAYYSLRAAHKQQSKYRDDPHLGRRFNSFSMCILPGYLPRLYTRHTCSRHVGTFLPLIIDHVCGDFDVSEEYVMHACFYTVSLSIYVYGHDHTLMLS